MITPPKRKRGFLTGLVAVATALTLSFSAAPAQADGPVIDLDATGSIILHKFEQPTTVGIEGDGLGGKDTTGLTPLEGIVFTAQRVTSANLTTNAGWEAVGDMTIAQAEGNLDPKGVVSTPTDARGDATIANLPVGLYYVTETTFPNNVTPVSPFLVTIPMTHPTELNTWIYDVHVYPKNATTTASKTVSDLDAVDVDDEIQWTILADIPKVQAIDKYEIIDDLDSKLRHVNTTVALTGTSGETLVRDTDYTVTPAPGEPVNLVFTPAGLAKLSRVWGADPTAQVQVVITTKVLRAGEIGNTATVYPNSRSNGRSTTPVVTKWGNIVLEKVNSKDPEAKLSGAQFRVYLTEEAARAKAPGTEISINGVSTFTSSDGDGIVLIEGLRYSGWVNGEAVAKGAANYRSYWIAETRAPSGFELLAAPFEVSVDSSSTTVPSQVVENVAKNAGFQLPLTGASGATTLIMGAGLLLLVLGTVAVIVSRRKRQVQA